MDVAISGDRACCLTHELGPDRYLFAVASGFGTVEGRHVAPAVLAKLRSEFERRSRGNRLCRAERRSKGLSSALSGAFTRVNEDLHARTASHEDYVTAGCSLTGALLVNDRAYLAHVGTTAAYLVRDGYVVSLTKNDAFEGGGPPVLMRALVSAPSIDVAICSFALTEGDALVLAGRRLREAEERRRLSECLANGAHAGSGDHLLVVRYSPPAAAATHDSACLVTARPFVTAAIATALFYSLLCLR